jgi:hypothetical protein
VKLEKNANNTCVIFSEAYGGEALKNQVFLIGTSSSKRVARTRKIKEVDIQDLRTAREILSDDFGSKKNSAKMVS